MVSGFGIYGPVSMRPSCPKKYTHQPDPLSDSHKLSGAPACCNRQGDQKNADGSGVSIDPGGFMSGPTGGGGNGSVVGDCGVGVALPGSAVGTGVDTGDGIGTGVDTGVGVGAGVNTGVGVTSGSDVTSGSGVRVDSGVAFASGV